MKKLTLIVMAVLLVAATTAHAGWKKIYWNGIGYCTQQTTNGNYIVSGDKFTDEDAWLLLVDTLGNVVWERNYSSSSWLVGRWVEQTIDGGYIIAPQNLALLKTNDDGDSLWAKAYDIKSYCVRQTSDSGYIICGALLGNPSLMALLKTNDQGDSLWIQTYMQNSWFSSWGYYVCETADKGFIAVGIIGDVSEEQERYGLWLVKTDSNGDTLWTYTQGGENWGDWEDGRYVIETPENEYIVLARTGLLKVSNVGDSLWMKSYLDGSCLDKTQNGGYIISGEVTQVTSLSAFLKSPDEMMLQKTDQNGDSLWRQGYGQGLLSHVRGTSDEGFITTGGDGNLIVIKTDSLGLLGVAENPIVETDNGWNVPHSIGSYIVLHYQGLPQGFHANVFDVSGQQVDQIRGDGNEGAMTWGINQPTGVYFIQALDNKNQLKTAKVVLVR